MFRLLSLKLHVSLYFSPRLARAHPCIRILALVKQQSPASLPYRSPPSSCLLRLVESNVENRELQRYIPYGSWNYVSISGWTIHRGYEELVRRQPESSAKWNTEIKQNEGRKKERNKEKKGLGALAAFQDRKWWQGSNSERHFWLDLNLT